LKIAIVILNWNGKQLLKQFLPSVIENSKEAEIYIADNASTDDSVAFVKTNYPSIKIVINEENGGFAKGYNDAVNRIEADVYCLLNNDIEVPKNWLPPIIDTFEKNPNTVILQPKILDFKNKAFFEYAGAAGGFIDKYSYPYCRGRIFNTLEEDLGQYNDISEIFWATGACFFVKSDIFKQFGGFDEHFFAHMEEIDLCWRIKNAGYSIKYVGASAIYHVGGATLNAINPKKTYLNFRNSLYALTKNAKGNLFFIVFTRLIIDGVAAAKFLFDLKPNHTLAILKAHVSYYRNLNRLLKQRKATKNRKKYYQKTSIVMDYFVNKNIYYKR
jgi:GT2 family glycosyltransferase